MKFVTIFHSDGRPNQTLNLGQVVIIRHAEKQIVMANGNILQLDDVTLASFMAYLLKEGLA